MLILALALAAPPASPLSDIDQRDIACVAVMGLHADDQRRKIPGHEEFPDVQQRGRKWAGIVGERIMQATGQPREIIGFALTEAVKAEQDRVGTADEPRSVIYNRFEECLPLMEADLAADAAANAPLPKPAKSQ